MSDNGIDTIDRPHAENGHVVSLTKSRAPQEHSDPIDTTPADTPTSGNRWKQLFRFGRMARRAALPAVAVLAIAASVLAAILGWKLQEHNDTDAAAQAGLAAARTYAVTLTSVDSNNLDRDFTAVLDGSTGEFKDMYTRSSGQLRQLLLENKAIGKGTVVDAAVKSASETKVEVLLFIDQTVTNTTSPDPRIDRSRVEMTLELVNGRWLASRVYLP